MTFARRHLLLLAAAVLLLPACGDSSTEPGPNLVGTWNAISIDGQNMPISETFTEDGFTCTGTLSSLTLVFSSNARFTATSVSSFSCGGLPPQTDTDSEGGTWRVESGNRLVIRNDGDTVEDTATFAIVNNRLTLTFEGDDPQVLVFQRH